MACRPRHHGVSGGPDKKILDKPKMTCYNIIRKRQEDNKMTTEIIIRNEPEYAHKYEFVVANLCEGEFWFYGAYRDGWKADQVASTLECGHVFHNVKIQGYKED